MNFNPNIKQNLKVVENITATVRDAITGKVKRIYKVKNTVQLAGMAVLARRLANETTYTGIINYGVLYTGGSPTESYRKLVSSAAYDDAAAKAYISHFFAAGDCNGTYTRFCNVIDGAAGSGTGQIWTQTAVSWTKTNLETLTIDAVYSFSAV